MLWCLTKFMPSSPQVHMEDDQCREISTSELNFDTQNAADLPLIGQKPPTLVGIGEQNTIGLLPNTRASTAPRYSHSEIRS